MAYYAELDADNIVLRVIRVPDNQEHRGHDYCALDLKLGGRWVQTSYNGTIRRRYAAVGFHYDETRDAFIPPQPYESWSLDDNHDWQAPVAQPEGSYQWNEDTQAWEPSDA